MPTFPDHYAPDDAVSPPRGGFEYVPSDSTDIIDPNTAAACLIRAVTVQSAGNIHVAYQDGTEHTQWIPAGRTSMIIRKIFATGTAFASVTCHY